MATFKKQAAPTEFVFALTVNDYFADNTAEFLQENSESYADADSHFCDVTVYTAPVDDDDDDERTCENCDDTATLPYFYSDLADICICVSHLSNEAQAFIEAHIS